MNQCHALQHLNGRYSCSALTKMNCDGCVFFKSREQKRIDDERTIVRLRQVRGEVVIR